MLTLSLDLPFLCELQENKITRNLFTQIQSEMSVRQERRLWIKLQWYAAFCRHLKETSGTIIGWFRKHILLLVIFHIWQLWGVSLAFTNIMRLSIGYSKSRHKLFPPIGLLLYSRSWKHFLFSLAALALLCEHCSQLKLHKTSFLLNFAKIQSLVTFKIFVSEERKVN